MNRKQWAALWVVLGLIGLTAGVLVRFGASQRLGQPGLKLTAEPTFITGGEVIRTQSVSLPRLVLDFASQPLDITPVEANWLPKDTLFGRRMYQAKDGFWAQVSAVLMGTDRTSIHKPQYCLDGQGWQIQKSETAVIPISRPYPYDLTAMKLTAARTVINTNGQSVKLTGIYVYWFVADHLLTPSHGERMWWMARELIQTGVLQRWAYVSFWTHCSPEMEELAFSRIKELIAASVPEFQLAAGPPSGANAKTAMLPDRDPAGKN